MSQWKVTFVLGFFTHIPPQQPRSSLALWRTEPWSGTMKTLPRLPSIHIRVEIARKNKEVFMSDAASESRSPGRTERFLCQTRCGCYRLSFTLVLKIFFLKVVVMVAELKTGTAGADTIEQNWTAADTLEWLKYHLWLFLKNFCCIIFLGKYLFNYFFSKQHTSLLVDFKVLGIFILIQ